MTVMKRRRFSLKMHEDAVLFCVLLLYSSRCISAGCPSMCSCSETFRDLDCSWRGLKHLPHGIQPNIHSLILSHNRLADLDHVLASFTHLRVLDISSNRLSHMPLSLPRSLWEIRASNNRIRILEKNNTVYLWNLRLLDLSGNKLERIVFINNTMPDLHALNLSCNRFWTVPTNMPRNLETVDLSHNTLVQILPGSLDRLPKLTHFYLHGNRFTTVCDAAFGQLQGLSLITLGDNPWACDDPSSIKHLLDWTRYTFARVIGCPCHTRPICGQVHLAKTTDWHFASYTLSPYPYATTSSESGVKHFWSEDGLHFPNQPHDKEEARRDGFYTSTLSSPAASHSATPADTSNPDDVLTSTTVLTSSTRRTTTLRTRSVKRNNPRTGGSANTVQSNWATLTVLLNLFLLITKNQVL